MPTKGLWLLGWCAYCGRRLRMEYLDTRRFCATCKRLGRDQTGTATVAKKKV